MAPSVVKKRLGTDRQDCRFQLKPIGTEYLGCPHNAVPRRTRNSTLIAERVLPRASKGGNGAARQHLRGVRQLTSA